MEVLVNKTECSQKVKQGHGRDGAQQDNTEVFGNLGCLNYLTAVGAFVYHDVIAHHSAYDTAKINQIA